MSERSNRRFWRALQKAGVAVALVASHELYTALGIDLFPTRVNPFSGEPVTTTGTTGIAHPLPPIDLSVLIDPMMLILPALLFGWAIGDFIFGLVFMANQKKAL